MMRFNIANSLTMTGIAIGFVSIVLLFHGAFHAAALLFPCIVLLDKLDGMAARRFGCATPMGKQLDSLADMLNFGSLIALFAYIKTGMHPAVAACAVVYVGCAAWRLARFNVDERRAGSFVGLPTTNAAAWLFVLSVGLGFMPGAYQWPVQSLLLLLAARVMVGTFRYDNSSLWTLVLYPLLPLAAVTAAWFQ